MWGPPLPSNRKLLYEVLLAFGVQIPDLVMYVLLPLAEPIPVTEQSGGTESPFAQEGWGHRKDLASGMTSRTLFVGHTHDRALLPALLADKEGY